MARQGTCVYRLPGLGHARITNLNGQGAPRSGTCVPLKQGPETIRGTLLDTNGRSYPLGSSKGLPAGTSSRAKQARCGPPGSLPACWERWKVGSGPAEYRLWKELGILPGEIIFSGEFYPCPRVEILHVGLSVGQQEFKAPPVSERGNYYGYSSREAKFR
ncbi:hypothetical protein ES708_22591 [subsurface metagenome]